MGNGIGDVTPVRKASIAREGNYVPALVDKLNPFYNNLNLLTQDKDNVIFWHQKQYDMGGDTIGHFKLLLKLQPEQFFIDGKNPAKIPADKLKEITLNGRVRYGENDTFDVAGKNSNLIKMRFQVNYEDGPAAVSIFYVGTPRQVVNLIFSLGIEKTLDDSYYKSINSYMKKVSDGAPWPESDLGGVRYVEGEKNTNPVRTKELKKELGEQKKFLVTLKKMEQDLPREIAPVEKEPKQKNLAKH